LLFLLLVASFLLLGAASENLIEQAELWRYWKAWPDQPPPGEWKELSLDDSGWAGGVSPIGYGDPWIDTVLDDMQDSYVTVYFRRIFSVTDPLQIEALRLEVWVDDGFIAYLNGVKVAEDNMPAAYPVRHTDEALSDTDAPDPSGPGKLFDLSDWIDLLGIGANILAVEVHNWRSWSADFCFEARLVADLKENPFPCLSEFQAQDYGDQSVHFVWSNMGRSFDRIEIEENGEVVLDDIPGTAEDYVMTKVEPGDHVYRIYGVRGGERCYGGIAQVTISPVEPFRRGDATDDGRINIMDPVYILHYLFIDGEAWGISHIPCFDAADANDDGQINEADAIYLLRYLFLAGEEPVSPGPTNCDIDPTWDNLRPCHYESCGE